MRLGNNVHSAAAASRVSHSIDDTQHQGLLWACMQGLLGMGAAVNARDKSGGTPLSTTAEECDRGRAAAALLAAGANVRAKNAAGEAPLYIAALRGHADLVQLLLAHHEQCGIAWTVGNEEPVLLCCLIHSEMRYQERKQPCSWHDEHVCVHGCSANPWEDSGVQVSGRPGARVTWAC